MILRTGARSPSRWGHLRLRSDDRGSMAFYLLFAVVGLSLGALVVPMIVTSARASRSDTSRVHAVDAAQAGVGVMLGAIRNATSDNVGTSTLLPCNGLTGTVNAGSVASYSVTVDYYMDDPVAVSGALKMRCVAGYGTYDPVSGAFTPKYARITSVGTDGTAANGSTPGRTLRSTYVLRSTNSNVVGGRIQILPPTSTSTAFCMDAGSATPVAGAPITMQVCSDPSENPQIFSYRTDLTLQLRSSVTAAYPLGLCIDSPTSPSSGAALFLSACTALGSPPYTEQWSFNDWGGFTASVPSSRTNGALSNLCMQVNTQAAGTALTLAGCRQVNPDNLQAWVPAPAAGAGGAQSPQLVNFYEFGRCLDVTNNQVGTDHLISYPCKQNPQPTAIYWNEKWVLPTIPAGATSGTGPIYTTPYGNNCLTSPGTDGGYPTVPGCDISHPTQAQTWTVYNGSPTLLFTTKYTIVDSTGRCLGLTVPKNSEPWSAIDVEPCTGATEQKWNATPDLTNSAVKDVTEVPNSP